jgi:3-hydroxyisobutyrate dehydrogenase-like beta-hydroxyacid dehydrogenase
MDLATLSYIYGAVLGFFHGARICEAEGFRVDSYGSIVADIAPTFGEFLKHEGAVIQTGNYAISESPLKISVEATERLVQTAREAQINTEFPTFASMLFKRAMDAGYGNEEAAALVKVLR